jgi:hypothetical protein
LKSRKEEEEEEEEDWVVGRSNWENKSIKMIKKTESTHQTCDSGHGVGITP